MTAIAWDGKTLAADRMATGPYDRIVRPGITKIKQCSKGMIAGVSGSGSSVILFFNWVDQGMHETAYPTNLDPEAGYFTINPHGIAWVYDHKGPSAKVDPPYAFGSGAEACLGAMWAGATAREAIEIASKVYANIGGGIDELTNLPSTEAYEQYRDSLKKPKTIRRWPVNPEHQDLIDSQYKTKDPTTGIVDLRDSPPVNILANFANPEP